MDQECKIHSDSKEVVFVPPSTFQFECHGMFRKAMDQVKPDQNLVVDLRHARYIDSAALGILLIANEKLGPKRVVLRHARPGVRRILEVANFQKLFKME